MSVFSLSLRNTMWRRKHRGAARLARSYENKNAIGLQHLHDSTACLTELQSHPQPLPQRQGKPHNPQKGEDEHFHLAFRSSIKHSITFYLFNREQISELALLTPLHVVLTLYITPIDRSWSISATVQTSLVKDAGSAKHILAD